MAYWLLKTEPETFSWDDQVKRGAKGEPWTGVRNFIARGNLKAMKKGEHAFFYHTGEEKQVVGIVEVIRESYRDPTDDTAMCEEPPPEDDCPTNNGCDLCVFDACLWCPATNTCASYDASTCADPIDNTALCGS